MTEQMKPWNIWRADDNSDSLEKALSLGYEPFAVTTRREVTTIYGNGDYGDFRSHDEIEIINVIWLKRTD